jgi:hypothetical protein
MRFILTLIISCIGMMLSIQDIFAATSTDCNYKIIINNKLKNVKEGIPSFSINTDLKLGHISSSSGQTSCGYYSQQCTLCIIPNDKGQVWGTLLMIIQTGPIREDVNMMLQKYTDDNLVHVVTSGHFMDFVPKIDQYIGAGQPTLEFDIKAK